MLLIIFQIYFNRYSLSVAPGMQEFYESYFKIAYPLPKQDLAVI
jgi:aminopeptidase N